MMAELNSVLLEGVLVRNPERKMLGERTVVRFPIAVHRYYKGKNNESVTETSFFDVQAWGGIADAAERFLSIGRTIRVLGRLKQDTWLEKEKNVHREKVFVIANHLEFRPKVRDEKGNVVLGTPITLDNDLDGISAGASAIMKRIEESVRLFRRSRPQPTEPEKSPEPKPDAQVVFESVKSTVYTEKDMPEKELSEDFDLTASEQDEIVCEINDNKQIPDTQVQDCSDTEQ